MDTSWLNTTMAALDQSGFDTENIIDLNKSAIDTENILDLDRSGIGTENIIDLDNFCGKDGMLGDTTEGSWIHSMERGADMKRKQTEDSEQIPKRRRTMRAKNNPDPQIEDTWAQFTDLPVLGRTKAKVKRRVVSVNNEMMYHGPLKKNRRNLLQFKIEMLQQIVKDEYTPVDISVYGNTLISPMSNKPIIRETSQGKEYKVNGKRALCWEDFNTLLTTNKSILKHLLIRYILDIGETGPFYTMRADSGELVNCNLEKAWSRGKRCSKDPVVSFFVCHALGQAQQFALKCKVYIHKEYLLDFIDTFDIDEMSKRAAEYGVSDKFVNKIKIRLNEAMKMLNGFQLADLERVA